MRTWTHTSYFPALVRDGFAGPVYATEGTTELCKLILPDSGYLSRLRRRKAIPDIPLYLNSPMAIDASGMYQRHPAEHRLKQDEYERMYSLATLTRSVDDSRLLNLRRGPMIIMSASGMPTGGRVLHHLAAYGPDPKNAIILSGYQAGGTRGTSLAAGDRELRIYGRRRQNPGRSHPAGESVRTRRHARPDQLDEGHTAGAAADLHHARITHGEPESSDVLQVRIKRELGSRARVPEHLGTARHRGPTVTPVPAPLPPS